MANSPGWSKSVYLIDNVILIRIVLAMSGTKNHGLLN